MIYKNLYIYIYIYIFLLLNFLIAACDSPKSEKTSKASSNTAEGETTKTQLIQGTTIGFAKKSDKASITETSSYKQEIRKTKEVADDTGAITYKSSDTSIATVDVKTGVVTLVEVGIITITATKAATDKYKASETTYKLTIIGLLLGTIIEYADTSATQVFSEGGTYTHPLTKTTVADDTGDITYTSSNTDIATIDINGEVTFVKAGIVSITATKAGTSNAFASSEAQYTLTIELAEGTVIEYADTSATQVFSEGGTYTHPLTKTTVAEDLGDITYTSSNTDIATIDINGEVTFVKAGIVSITVRKAATDKYKASEATYELSIKKFKPTTKAALVAEIKRAVKAKGNKVNLNYIDTSAITDMSDLFARYGGYDLKDFNGDISNWDVSKVKDMNRMFLASAFKGDISRWKVQNVTDMQSMFHHATAFTQNLDTWVINVAIRNNNWAKAKSMFTDSGLANNLPSWCESDATCKTKVVLEFK